MDTRPWHPISTAPRNEVVETKIDDENGERNVQRLSRDGNLWWVPDGSMYVYYTPTGGTPSDHSVRDPS